MSRIYFHTPEAEAEVAGSERAFMANFASDLALIALHLAPWADDADRDWAQSITSTDYSAAMFLSDQWVDRWQTWFRVGRSDKEGVLIDGEVVPTMDLALNTLIATHSPVFQFMAKIHGTCEDHAWFEAEHAEWIANLIRQGRKDNVLRPEQGWESVADLCDAVATGTTSGPIVLSYSVCEGFPNADVAAPFWVPNPAAVIIPDGYAEEEGFDEDGFRRDAAWAAWYDLASEEQWRLAEAGMRARAYSRQISPDTLPIGFLSGHSAFDLAAARWINRRQVRS